MIRIGAGESRWLAIGLVRDAAGRPKIDNIRGIPPEIWRMLSSDEQREVTDHGGYPSDDSDAQRAR